MIRTTFCRQRMTVVELNLLNLLQSVSRSSWCCAALASLLLPLDCTSKEGLACKLKLEVNRMTGSKKALPEGKGKKTLARRAKKLCPPSGSYRKWTFCKMLPGSILQNPHFLQGPMGGHKCKRWGSGQQGTKYHKQHYRLRKLLLNGLSSHPLPVQEGRQQQPDVLVRSDSSVVAGIPS